MWRLKGKIASLSFLAILVLFTMVARVRGDVVAYIALLVISILALNAVFILAGKMSHRDLMGIYIGYTIFMSVLSALGLLRVFDNLVDLIYIALLVSMLAIYHHNSSIREVLTAYMPVIILVSAIISVYLGLQNSLRYTILALIDTFSAIIVLSSLNNYVTGFTTCLLLFILLYFTPFLILDTTVFFVLLVAYVLKILLILYNKIRYLRLIVSLELLVRPVLVIYL